MPQHLIFTRTGVDQSSSFSNPKEEQGGLDSGLIQVCCCSECVRRLCEWMSTRLCNAADSEVITRLLSCWNAGIVVALTFKAKFQWLRTWIQFQTFQCDVTNVAATQFQWFLLFLFILLYKSSSSYSHCYWNFFLMMNLIWVLIRKKDFPSHWLFF